MLKPHDPASQQVLANYKAAFVAASGGVLVVFHVVVVLGAVCLLFCLPGSCWEAVG